MNICSYVIFNISLLYLFVNEYLKIFKYFYFPSIEHRSAFGCSCSFAAGRLLIDNIIYVCYDNIKITD